MNKDYCGEMTATEWMKQHPTGSQQASQPVGLHPHPNSARFHDILKELGQLHDRKQIDYGKGDDPFANVRASQEWGVKPWVGAMIRATDKVRRLQAFVQNGKLANEGVQDSLRDLAVYAVIALVLFEER